MLFVVSFNAMTDEKIVMQEVLHQYQELNFTFDESRF
jgi:hypothetical protein